MNASILFKTQICKKFLTLIKHLNTKCRDFLMHPCKEVQILTKHRHSDARSKSVYRWHPLLLFVFCNWCKYRETIKRLCNTWSYAYLTNSTNKHIKHKTGIRILIYKRTMCCAFSVRNRPISCLPTPQQIPRLSRFTKGYRSVYKGRKYILYRVSWI